MTHVESMGQLSSKDRIILFTALAVLVVAAGLIFGYDRLSLKNWSSTYGHFELIRNDVRVKSVGEVSWYTAYEGQGVEPLDRIFVGDNSLARVRLSNNEVLEFRSNTLAVFDQQSEKLNVQLDFGNATLFQKNGVKETFKAPVKIVTSSALQRIKKRITNLERQVLTEPDLGSLKEKIKAAEAPPAPAPVPEPSAEPAPPDDFVTAAELNEVLKPIEPPAEVSPPIVKPVLKKIKPVKKNADLVVNVALEEERPQPLEALRDQLPSLKLKLTANEKVRVLVSHFYQQLLVSQREAEISQEVLSLDYPKLEFGEHEFIVTESKKEDPKVMASQTWLNKKYETLKKPQLVFPREGHIFLVSSELVDSVLQFKAQKIKNATSYLFQVSKNETFSSSDLEWVAAEPTSRPSQIIKPGKWFIRVRALGQNGFSDWSEVRMFKLVRD